MAKKNNLYINIKDDKAELAILADFLRDGEISSRSIVALSAFYLSLAIAKSPNSTPEDIRKAEHYCLSQLKQQMCYIMDKHHRDDGIDMDASEFSTVTINQSAPSNLGLLPLVQSPSIVGVAAQNGNGEATLLPSSLNTKDLEQIPAANLATSDRIVEQPKNIEEDEEDDEDDEDDESEMSDEEYLASKQHLLIAEKIK